MNDDETKQQLLWAEEWADTVADAVYQEFDMVIADHSMDPAQMEVGYLLCYVVG